MRACPNPAWAEVWPGCEEMTREDLDGLHDLWPDYWPPASAVHGGEPCGCAWCVANGVS